jgi:hypothetical protein
MVSISQSTSLLQKKIIQDIMQILQFQTYNNRKQMELNWENRISNSVATKKLSKEKVLGKLGKGARQLLMSKRNRDH